MTLNILNTLNPRFKRERHQRVTLGLAAIFHFVCIEEVVIRTTFSHMTNIAVLIYYTCSLVIEIQCTRYRNAFNERF